MKPPIRPKVAPNPPGDPVRNFIRPMGGLPGPFLFNIPRARLSMKIESTSQQRVVDVQRKSRSEGAAGAGKERTSASGVTAGEVSRIPLFASIYPV